MTAEINGLKGDLVKAQKSLDHATPGVWNSFQCLHVLLLILLAATDLLLSKDFHGYSYVHACILHLKYASMNDYLNGYCNKKMIFIT